MSLWNWVNERIDIQSAKDFADYFYNSIDSLKGQIHIAEDLLEQAEQKGMEVSNFYFYVEEARKMLIQSSTNIHSFNKEFISKTAEAGFKSSNIAVKGA